MDNNWLCTYLTKSKCAKRVIVRATGANCIDKYIILCIDNNYKHWTIDQYCYVTILPIKHFEDIEKTYKQWDYAI